MAKVAVVMTSDEQLAQTEDFNFKASELMKQLPDHIYEHIVSLAAEYRVPLWQFVCGLVLDSYQLGRLSAFQLDPAWKDGFKGGTYECAWCGREFTPKRIKQVYCSQECGMLAEDAKLNRTKKETSNARPIDATTAMDTEDSTSAGTPGVDSPDSESDVLAMLDAMASQTTRQTSDDAESCSVSTAEPIPSKGKFEF